MKIFDELEKLANSFPSFLFSVNSGSWGCRVPAESRHTGRTASVEIVNGCGRSEDHTNAAPPEMIDRMAVLANSLDGVL